MISPKVTRMHNSCHENISPGIGSRFAVTKTTHVSHKHRLSEIATKAPRHKASQILPVVLRAFVASLAKELTLLRHENY
ncbi:MAG: hypothetical protein U9Q77_00020, partial [Candidatus Marinimicrobia bacterium]|nr:hypothetical protein [Candidatus Neomarinimicrobiota bacterium]